MDDDTFKFMEKNGTSVSVLADSHDSGRGLLKIDFDEDESESAMPDSKLYQMLQESDLNFLYQEENESGGISRVFSFAERTN
jgi:hypothetical protein